MYKDYKFKEYTYNWLYIFNQNKKKLHFRVLSHALPNSKIIEYLIFTFVDKMQIDHIIAVRGDWFQGHYTIKLRLLIFFVDQSYYTVLIYQLC
mgnify:CR=1 FL=1